MPRRAPPPDRAACEDALLPEEVIALRMAAEALGVAPERWTRVPALALVWGTVAVVRIAARLREGSGLGAGRALAVAAGRVGLPEETIRSRLSDFLDQSLETKKKGG